ncbi:MULTISPECIES: zinc-binding dehydrogenase [Deinococcus]|uniref:Zinc-binding dehydrogenase n=1 Tax=Deinococcus rufus TaxID=2136097 RepID=A0ABV7Z816_9DEIO|nr:zinc-binding dehydrogenase [Deinococcus sp. AB2017081]WQE97416.1 zinc-binding dehydrogenase [Deinococcus sp. AB2017081]
MTEVLAALVAAGEVAVPIAATSPLERVRGAYRHLDQRHPLGRIVLRPGHTAG